MGEAKILRTATEYGSSKRYYIECPPHYRRVVFSNRRDFATKGFQTLRDGKLLLDLPLPWTYYVIISGNGIIFPRLVASNPTQLKAWNKKNPGYVLPLPNLFDSGALCSPSVSISKSIEDPNEMIDLFWQSCLNILEGPGKCHEELAKWAGVEHVGTHQHPDPAQYEKWAELSLEELKDQPWMWATPMPTNSYYGQGLL